MVTQISVVEARGVLVAEVRPFQLPNSNEAIAVFRKGDTETVNIYATRTFYRWLAQIEALIGSPSVLQGLEDEGNDLQDQINALKADVVSLQATVAAQAIEISSLQSDLASVTTGLSTHEAATSVHGASGDVIGDANFAGIGPPVPGILVRKGSDPGASTAVDVLTLRNDYNQLRSSLVNAGALG